MYSRIRTINITIVTIRRSSNEKLLHNPLQELDHDFVGQKMNSSLTQNVYQ